MQLCLIDGSPARLKHWTACCRKESIELITFNELSSDALRASSHSRIMVLDESVLGADLHSAENIVKVLRQDVLVFSLANPSCAHTVRLMDIGADWVIDNSCPEKELKVELQSLLRLAQAKDENLQQYQTLNQVFSSFSEGENQVLRLVLGGKQNNHIAEELQVSVRTIEARRAKILQKCNATTIIELARCFDQHQTLQRRFCGI